MKQQMSNAIMTKDRRSIIDVFADNVRLFPDRLAVETRDQQRTYAELASRVERFAAEIAARTGAEGGLIGVCLDRDVDLPAWLLAILTIGGAYLPIDHTLPKARMAHVLEDAVPALIVSSRRFAAAFENSALPILVIDELDDLRPLPAIVPRSIRPDALAYVIFTSGSTGRPKGVEIEHRSLVALIQTMAVSPGFCAGEKMLGITRLSFDLSVPDIFLPLFVGGSLAIVDLEIAADADQLAAAFAYFKPDLVQATPSSWRALVERGWSGQQGLRILAGGEAVTRALADRLLPCCTALWNIYGPTETTVWATHHHVLPGSHDIPIGRAMAGVWVEVADENLRILPPGEVGEILIGGDGVARGYRNRSELTAARFVDLADGRRVYRTGDLGRFDDNGELFCLGRLDDQVKVRGYRIELGDIEAALAIHPQVVWVAVRLWTDTLGEPALVGYIVVRPNVGLTMRELKAFLATRLPAYMLPDRIVTIDAMPLTANGKIDRAALPSPFNASGLSLPPSAEDTTINRLRAIWRELLGIDVLRNDADFFDLGGYSLMTVRLARQIDIEFGVKLALIELLRHSTLVGMAHRIDHGATNDSATMLLNDGGNRLPLFWIDAGPLMRTMARLLPPSQPAYSLNVDPHDEAALGSGMLSIPDIAALLRIHLVAKQPVGPYYLGGWCRWAFVAFELASQLIKDGEEVALLVILDAEISRKRFAPAGLRAKISGWIRRDQTSSEPESFSQRVEVAARAYLPRSYEGDVLLFRSTGALEDGGWRAVVRGKLTNILIAGDHLAMVRMPLVQGIADTLGLSLASAQAQRPVLKSPRRSDISRFAE